MLLYLLLAAAGLYAWKQMNPSGGGLGFGTTDDAGTETELGVTEDGTFVLVEKAPTGGVFAPPGAMSPIPPAIPGSVSLPPGTDQKSVWGEPKSMTVGHMGGQFTEWYAIEHPHPSVGSIGCGPGKSCCADCKKGVSGGAVRVGAMGAVPVRAIRELSAQLAARVAAGDPGARERAAQLFEVALSAGANAQERMIAEELVRAMDVFRPTGLPARRVRVAVDDPNIRRWALPG